MKKILAMALVLCMMFALCATASAEGTTRVAMITDYGDITDQSFNQTTYEACKEFCEEKGIDFKYYKPGSDSDEDRISSIEDAIDENFNVIVMPGYAFAGTIVEAAPNYPDVKFVALDVALGDLLEAGVTAAGGEYDYDPTNWNLDEYVDMSNVYCAVYQEELCGYMAGYAAVKLGYTKLGFLGGMAVPAVIRYGYGFVQGANAAADELGVDVELKYVYGGQFYGDGDITAAMDTWYKAGTEVVFACGGGIFTSVAEAAAAAGGKIIGVDVDQAPLIDGIYGEGITLTSAVKAFRPVVYDVLASEAMGSFPGNYPFPLGIWSENPANNYVQLADSTRFNDSFTREDYADLAAAVAYDILSVSDEINCEPGDYATVIELIFRGNLK